jgi:hypothetical protein
MKPSLTDERTSLFFDLAEVPKAISASSPAIKSSEKLTLAERPHRALRNGFSIARWPDALPLWRTALAKLPDATLYHRERWLEALRSCYPFDLRVATLHRHGELRAAAVLARSRKLFSTRMMSLPFSDSGEILAVDADSASDFCNELVASNEAHSIEIRGTAGPAPWKNVDCFLHWKLDLKRPFAEIYAGISRNVKNGMKRARKDNIQIERGGGLDYISRYYELQLATRRRLGVPPQPARFFTTVHENFSKAGDCETWFATRSGADLAGLIVLREGDDIYYKWGARAESAHPGANHLLVMRMIEEFAGKARSLDLGRCDSRNQGLCRSKSELGAVSRPLPYAFFPAAPRHISSEVLSGPAKLVSEVWKKLPLPVTRVLGEALYRYLA